MDILNTLYSPRARERFYKAVKARKGVEKGMPEVVGPLQPDTRKRAHRARDVVYGRTRTKNEVPFERVNTSRKPSVG